MTRTPSRIQIGDRMRQVRTGRVLSVKTLVAQQVFLIV